jgi:hypothetical protein
MSNLHNMNGLVLACGTVVVALGVHLAAALSHASSSAAASANGTAAVFPEVRGSNLDGREFDLPKDFEGELNLVFIAFQREQQSLVDSWVPLAKTLTDRHEGLCYYELPTIYQANSLVRWFINNGMRRGIPDPHARKTTITLYIDKEPFRTALGIPDEQTICVLLVDAGGRVLWRNEGAYTDEKGRELDNVISSTLQGKTME